jgi:hypothetical protein
MTPHKFSKSTVKSQLIGQTRDAGFEHETKDCAVVALAAVTGVPYRDAHAFCKTVLGRVDRQGTVIDRLHNVTTEKRLVYGFRVFTHKSPSKGVRRFTSCDSYGNREHHMRPQYQTLAQFAASHPRGRFLCSSRNHSFAVINGVVHDNGAASPRTQVHGMFYEFIESSKCEATGVTSAFAHEDRLAAIR